jgi:hypothetical protein
MWVITAYVKGMYVVCELIIEDVVVLVLFWMQLLWFDACGILLS